MGDRPTERRRMKRAWPRAVTVGALVFGAIVIVQWIDSNRERAARAASQERNCRQNLLELYQIAQRSAGHSDGRWPQTLEQWAAEVPTNALTCLVCPGSNDENPASPSDVSKPGYCSYRLYPPNPSSKERRPLLIENVAQHHGKRHVLFTDRSVELVAADPEGNDTVAHPPHPATTNAPATGAVVRQALGFEPIRLSVRTRDDWDLRINADGGGLFLRGDGAGAIAHLPAGSFDIHRLYERLKPSLFTSELPEPDVVVKHGRVVVVALGGAAPDQQRRFYTTNYDQIEAIYEEAIKIRPRPHLLEEWRHFHPFGKGIEQD